MKALDFKGNKAFRLLSIYERLCEGGLLTKFDLAEDYGVSEKTIQRDIADLRVYLHETHIYESKVKITYDRIRKVYYLEQFNREWLTGQEVLGICKVLLESRAFRSDEMNVLIDKLIVQALPNEQEQIKKLTGSEKVGFTPLQHGKPLLDNIWQLSSAISETTIISIVYRRLDGMHRTHKVKPVAIMFSEFYFYLICYMADDSKKSPTTFRIDRIERIEPTKEKFKIPHSKRFSDGEFRKRVQFMYAGDLQTVKFRYTGPSIEAVLDRLPTATVEEDSDGSCIVRAEAYGDGILMWLKSQGEYVEVI